MRVLLASIECVKGDLKVNLARHVQMMVEAHRNGCELTVFPEFSLTGSVDPTTHPKRVITLDDPAVLELIAEAEKLGMAAVFGLAEAFEDGFAITQAYTVNGQLAGVQRKRHLGEGEDGYTPSTDTAVFEYGSARFGSMICAEAGVDFTWDQTHAAGAPIILFCSAPGLYGRRVTEDDWRAGLEWWEGCGLADAMRHASRLGVWVAMATQAGSTEDEDFPGIAALIDPAGHVIDRLPDWRPGSLIVEVPVSIEVEPIRWSIRVVVVDEEGRTLLAEFGDDSTGQRWWVPPGGGIEPGEDDISCARRELNEELGRDDLAIGPQIGRRGGTFPMNGRWFTQYERWYLCRCEHFDVDPDTTAAVRAEGIRNLRWWTSEELRVTGTVTGPRTLPVLLDRILANDLLAPDSDLGF